ncbi:MAG TPA: CPBP family intramembrane metalloprotease [Bacilli bacterium]|nr:CPBP family intramembrane metalloprotease [Bacilli bacterium]
MIIRCNKCFKVLHAQEVYCTRCGEKSNTVEEYMNHPNDQYLTNFSHMKIGLSLYFFVCFLLNGLLSIMLGVYYYQVIDQTIDFGTIGSNIPIEVLSFSQSYSLFVIGIAASIIYTFYNRKTIFLDIKSSMLQIKTNAKSVFFSLGIFLIGGTTLWFVSPFIQMNAIVPPSLLMYVSQGRISIWIIVVVLVLFAYVEELVFRKMVIEGLDERFLFTDVANFLIMSITYTFFHFLIFLDFSVILPTFIFGILMAIIYRKNKDQFFIGFAFRVTAILIILWITLS